MRRMTVILCAALLLAALAFGCGKKDPAAVQLPDPSDGYGWMTTAETTTGTQTEPEEATGEEETLPEGVYTSIVYLTSAPTTQPGVTTAKPPVLSGNASATTKAPGNTTIPSVSTTKPPATNAPATTTTTKPGATQYYPNGINIAGKDEALSRFNAAVKRVIDGKAGFAKSHMITYKDWTFDQGLLDGLPDVIKLFNPTQYLSDALNTALGKGIRSASVYKGDSSSLLKSSTLTMGDLKDVTYSGSAGGEWTVTLLVNDGQTRQEKRLFGNNKSSGTSPIDKGPLGLAAASIYDHMDADKVFGLIKDSFSFLNVEPIDVQENTSQVQFVAKLDGQGRFIELRATYNQTINLKDIRVLNGMQSYKDNKGSSAVTVTFDSFVY